MSATIQIMVLPSAASDKRPQILLNDGGAWREMRPAYNDDPNTTADSLRSAAERELNQAMAQVETNGAYDPTTAAFTATFKSLYNLLVPEGVQEALRDLTITAADPPTLRIFLHPFGEWIPWELLHDGTNFLGLRFPISRIPILRQPNKARGTQQRHVTSVFSLLGNAVFDNGGQTEWAATFELGATPVTQLPSGNGPAPMFPSVDDLETAAKEADVIHITCHGGLIDPVRNEAYWTLNDTDSKTFSYRIRSDIAKSLDCKQRPLVFGNACASAAAGQRSLLYGFGGDFLYAGALNFIGTLAPITKSMALKFAKKFYGELIGRNAPGKSIATALWSTKNGFHNQKARDDPSYLFYSLYGPSETTYEVP
jgi:CHAT domain-containing protein